MTVTTRQNRLLISEDWKKIYQSFRNADFQSYDFENLRRTMIDYIRINFPEDFNDYIESSEYLALIDLIAFLGQSIAFRVDLNARENFLELAERRDSILRLARMLSYNAKRNVAASGLLKFTTVSTTENVVDSNGRNLSGQVVAWNDASNANWYDQFYKIINAAMASTQQFGNPIDKADIYGIPTESYTFQSNINGVPIFTFTKGVAGKSMNFEIVSTTFKGESFIYEEAPKVNNPLSFIYRDDGRGPSSSSNGFFLRFVQGTLNTGTFSINQPGNNESIDIDAQNINNSDVWLYRLDQNDQESELWSQVPSLQGNNIIYNSLKKGIRNTYAVITRAGDQVSLQFSDGTFGNLPLGNFRAYYRVSNGLSYTINTQDIRSVSITVPYKSQTGQTENLTIGLTLTSSVSNATTTESNSSIKSNAPATYYTQNRMITGEDYNITPLSANSQVIKVKSVNRSSAGISRYFDLLDPTGKYSSTNIFADDGVIYFEDLTPQVRFRYNSKTDIEGFIYNQVFDILKKESLRNYYYANFTNFITASLNITWKNVTTDTNSSSGYVNDAVSSTIYKVGTYTATDLKYFTVGSLIKFSASSSGNKYFDTKDSNKIKTYSPGNTNVDGGVDSLWAEVVSVIDDGTGRGTGLLDDGFGPITLNRNIPSDAFITQIIPRWRTSIESSTIIAMIDLIFANKPFGLRYDSTNQTWVLVLESNLNISQGFNRGNQGDLTNQQQDASWLLLFTTDNEYYTVTSRERRYIFESQNEVRFYIDTSRKTYDSKTNTVVKDLISVLSINIVPDDTKSFTTDQKFDIIGEFVGFDGYVDNKKVLISFADSDSNGVVDDPELFLKIVAPNISDPTKYVVQQRYIISQGQEDYRYISNEDNKVLIKTNRSAIGGLTQYKDGQYFYLLDSKTVKKLDIATSQLIPTLDYKVYLGRDNLKFQYTHSADYDSRIDPGASNIMDVYVLTKNYDTVFRQWLSGAITDKPLPPGSDELYDIVSPSLNPLKTISDEVIYHPISYKVLFGQTADQDLQASFKVVKNPNKVVSDNDVKARVISAFNKFFAIENWDFGDTFYFSELATFVMNELTPDISSIVIVPRQAGLNFGSLFEIQSSSDQIFINGATVDDIEIINNITPSLIKAITGTSEVSNNTLQNITSSPYGETNG